jgi:autoinducer 2-binding protein LuxP
MIGRFDHFMIPVGISEDVWMWKLTFQLYVVVLTPLAMATQFDFWTLGEYLNHHPDQLEITEQFQARVFGNATPLKIQQERPLKIHMIYPSRQISDYWRRSTTAFQVRLDELGIAYTLKIHDITPETQASQLLKLLNRAIAAKPDFLILTVDSLENTELIAEVIRRQKTRVIIQNVTTPIKPLGAYQPFLYVGFDHILGSQMIGDYFIEKTKGKGKYAVYYYGDGYVSHARGHSFIDYVSHLSHLELISDDFTGITQGDAYHATIELLNEHPDIDFIYTCATDLSLGSGKAVSRLGKSSDLAISGWGGGSQELEAIHSGQLDVTVMRMNDDNGVAMAEAIKLVLEGQPESVPTVYSGTFKLVTATTQTEALERRAFRYSSPTKNAPSK